MSEDAPTEILMRILKGKKIRILRPKERILDDWNKCINIYLDANGVVERVVEDR